MEERRGFIHEKLEIKLLILFVLPGMLTATDRLIIKRNKPKRSRKKQD